MKNEIWLNIKDFGAIKQADIELRKLNVIAGFNGSGKSTSSKLLSCFLTATSKEGNYLANKSIFDKFNSFLLGWYHRISQNQSDDVNIEGILTLIDSPVNFKDNSFNDSLKKRINLLKEIIDKLEFPEKQKFFEELSNIENLSQLYDDEHYRYFNVTNVLLNSEFNFSELKDYKKAYVHFHGNINDCEFSHEIDFNGDKIGAKISKGYLNCLNLEDIIYFDSPSNYDLHYALNSMGNTNKIPRHLKFLRDLIITEKELDVFDDEYYKKIEKYLEFFENLIDGFIYFDSKKDEFIYKQGSNEYSMKNTASGIKQIGVISLLLRNRSLRENSFVIMDEPEINLHPEWQLRLAELLILLIKELNIYLYINTQSPQFIEALEVFSAKYGLRDDCKFYLSEKDENNYIFNEIKREELFRLYDDLGFPYDEIDEIRADNFVKGIN